MFGRIGGGIAGVGGVASLVGTGFGAGRRAASSLLSAHAVAVRQC